MNTQWKKISAWERRLKKAPSHKIFKIALVTLIVSIGAGMSLQKIWSKAQQSSIEAEALEAKELEKKKMQQRIDWIKQQRISQNHSS